MDCIRKKKSVGIKRLLKLYSFSFKMWWVLYVSNYGSNHTKVLRYTNSTLQKCRKSDLLIFKYLKSKE